MPSEDARVAIVTGVSRRAGIGFAIARRLMRDGHRVLVHSWSPVDHEHGLAEPAGTAAVLRELGGESEHLAHVEADLSEAAAGAVVVDAAFEAFGAVDVLVVNHAFSPSDRLETTTAELLDRTWRTNARAAVLLAQAFARRYDERRGDGRIVLFTSGQHREPMPAELSYAISKGALHQMTPTLADELGERGITVNAVNPGPVDTGWPSEQWRRRLAPSWPSGRWGRPDDIAHVVAWLCSRESAWVTGNVIDAEGGFRRRAGVDRRDETT
jgi:3-oxoacyl-[acyl-carrier protein] reductase